MNTLAQILKSKAKQPVTSVSPAASARDAARLMNENGIGSLLVMEDERIVGIVTERDFTCKVIPYDRPSGEISVAEIMTRSVVYVESTQTAENCMALMTEHRVRHLPVMEGGKLLGLVSIGDLVKDTISGQQFIIEQLEHYIAGDLA